MLQRALAGAGTPPDDLAAGDATQVKLLDAARDVFAGRFRPELNDAPELAMMVWGGIHGVISLWFTHQNDPNITFRDVRETVRTMCDTMMRGAIRNPS